MYFEIGFGVKIVKWSHTSSIVSPNGKHPLAMIRAQGSDGCPRYVRGSHASQAAAIQLVRKCGAATMIEILPSLPSDSAR